ncbi:hypothetical protein ABZ342_15305 [Amycolatopsis sp. NPDC005961]|uniref:hypothetical protein n=1 Tax=Amycolatopsis sp. NPDC005961 TaxID=3156720 RepID=UPI0033E9864B
MMGEVLGDIATYGLGAVVGAAVLCGLCPRLILRLILLVYPRDDERRPELIGELERVPYRERLIWVADQTVTAVFDGIAARFRSRKRHKSNNDWTATSAYTALLSDMNKLKSAASPGVVITVNLGGDLEPDKVVYYLEQSGINVDRIRRLNKDEATYRVRSVGPSKW